jgi:hypothetical protein
MTAPTLERLLADFANQNGFKSQGPLSVALVITDRARKSGLPLDPNRLLTGRGGQVAGLGGDAVQAILARHDISRVLAREGGRTSRGSIEKMRQYVEFLNELHDQGLADLDAVERFWIGRVRAFFAGKPFKLRVDAARGMRAVMRDIVEQANERRQANPSIHYVGAIMQHLVGAKLDCKLGKGALQHNSFSTADEPGGRAGDFLVEDVALHVTASPSDALIEKCKTNLDSGLRPVIITLDKGVVAGEQAAERAGLAGRIDILEFEQFIATNIYEIGRFRPDGRKVAVEEIIKRYNEIIEQWETDPSLAIEVRA